MHALYRPIEAAYRDIECAVLPEQIVSHYRVRERRAIWQTGRTSHSWHGERRDQVGGVACCLHTCRFILRCGGRTAGCLAADCGAVWWSHIGLSGCVRIEQHTGRGRGVVGNDGVVDQVDTHGILQRDSASGPAGDVIRNDVVGDIDLIPRIRIVWTACHLGAIDILQPQAAALTAFGGIANDQVAINRDAGANAVGKLRRAILVDRSVLAESTVRSDALDDDATAVGW